MLDPRRKRPRAGHTAGGLDIRRRVPMTGQTIWIRAFDRMTPAEQEAEADRLTAVAASRRSVPRMIVGRTETSLPIGSTRAPPRAAEIPLERDALRSSDERSAALLAASRLGQFWGCVPAVAFGVMRGFRCRPGSCARRSCRRPLMPRVSPCLSVVVTRISHRNGSSRCHGCPPCAQLPQRGGANTRAPRTEAAMEILTRLSHDHG